MGIPSEAPQAVHDHWANVPNCGDIVFRFKSPWLGRIVKVKCEAWGQLQNDEAANRYAMHHIMNKGRHWDWHYDGWESVGHFDPQWSKAGGPRPGDFDEKLKAYIASWKR